MKTLNLKVCKIILLILTGFCFSCQKFKPNSVLDQSPPTSANDSTNYPLTIIFTASEHTFTDVQISYDDKIFLLEGGRLKCLIGSQLEEVQLPASIYIDFNPQYLAISKDSTFYLRAANGIKVIKNKQLIHHYKVGVHPLPFVNSPEDFGNIEIEIDGTDQSLIFGVYHGNSDPNVFGLEKITKDGHFRYINLARGFLDNEALYFLTAFGIGGTPGALWVSGVGTGSTTQESSSLFKFPLNASVFHYPNSLDYPQREDYNSFSLFPKGSEGAIDSVRFDVLSDIEVSKDGKTVYFKTGATHDPNVVGISNTGDILRILDNQVKIIARNVENKRLAISNDGKTLYIAGNGLAKIDF
ncbi:MAG: hypothetical protein JWR05_2320 [Mucilaginibacter sp.]|nr:hypothetical protein [Mucilaginibacter sp.]